jgi:DNA repair protein RadA/Sms
MSKAKPPNIFLCSSCGHTQPKWAGQCPACREWNSLSEFKESAARRGGGRRSGVLALERGGGSGTSGPVQLDEVEAVEHQRMTTRIGEFDFVLGGGVVAGSMILIGGEPGIGKSTILGQVSGRLNAAGHRTLYVSGEENAEQVQMRARRLGPESTKVAFLSEPEIGRIIEHATRFEPRVLILDSIQTVYSEELDGRAGDVSQMRECAVQIQRYAKDRNVAVFIVGHVTKDGALAGPKTLEHVVDTVLYFEHAGDFEHRIMRATKNRFGGVNEIAVFRMSERGLEAVDNPSALFLADRSEGTSGSAVTATIEGSRPLLIEVQALTTVAPYGTPQRVSTGYNRQRLQLLLAVLEKRAGLSFAQHDVFLNVVGGAQIDDPSADAAVAMALASSRLDQPLPEDAIFLGEVGLGGEIRRTGQLERRLIEAERMGFKTAHIARKAAPQTGKAELRVDGSEHLAEMVGKVLNLKDGGRRASAPASPGRAGKSNGQGGGGVGRKRLNLEPTPS